MPSSKVSSLKLVGIHDVDEASGANELRDVRGECCCDEEYSERVLAACTASMRITAAIVSALGRLTREAGRNNGDSTNVLLWKCG